MIEAVLARVDGVAGKKGKRLACTALARPDSFLPISQPAACTSLQIETLSIGLAIQKRWTQSMEESPQWSRSAF
ncbi:hypothetical protein [Synechococcus sp. CCY 9618]|uniref:hypothetical protein n=1 Tax=Synechococcus sp. CCY 9618 TaxID=2815602 RepID=UPI001C211E8C|nr:hypothetical protein [Synechococcus sp. CCY 9618]